MFRSQRSRRGTLVGEKGEEAATRLESFIGPIEPDIRARLIKRWPNAGLRVRSRGVHLGTRRNSRAATSMAVRRNLKGRAPRAQLLEHRIRNHKWMD